MTSGRPDAVKQQVAAHWDRRAAHFDEDFGHSIRTPAERAAWDRILNLLLAGRGALDALQIETLLGTHGLVNVGSDALLDLVAAQEQRMVEGGRERIARRRYVVWGDVAR